MVRSQERPDITIALLARAGGVGVETVRYYQRRGLMEVPPAAGAIRRYASTDVARLRFIRQAQAAGFTLEEIRELARLDRCDDRSRVRQMAASRVEALDAQIADLSHARDKLARLAKACAAGTSGPCPIIEAFED